MCVLLSLFATPWTARLLCSWISQARILEWVVITSLGDLPYLQIEPMSPAWQADGFFTTVPSGKPKDLILCTIVD